MEPFSIGHLEYDCVGLLLSDIETLSIYTKIEKLKFLLIFDTNEPKVGIHFCVCIAENRIELTCVCA